MPPKTVRRALKDVLEDLSELEMKNFCSEVVDRKDEPRVRRSALEDKIRGEVADVLISILTESLAKQVALEILGRIGCNEQKESFAKDTSEGSLTVFPSVSKYGDIMTVETTGASMQTAQQDNLKYSGIKASHAMAETDLFEMNDYKSIIQNVARQKGIDPALIAAIISRSCRAGKTLTGGKGYYDEKTGAYTFGLMQIYVNPKGGGHVPKGAWDSEQHLCQCTDILIRSIVNMKHRFPDWSKEQQLKGGLAVYSSGILDIRSYEEVDAKTSGGDYSNDVIARAQWYKSEGGF